jgi:hypothetical protein
MNKTVIFASIRRDGTLLAQNRPLHLLVWTSGNRGGRLTCR